MPAARSKARSASKHREDTFSIPDALLLADRVMALPCAGRYPRVPGRGELVQRFAIPLSLCKTTNELISMAGAAGRASRGFGGSMQIAAFKDRLYRIMWVQCTTMRSAPLEGRAQLRCVRFSSAAPDRMADGFKTAIDLLRVPVPPKWDAHRNRFVGGKKGFGFLIEDDELHVEECRWWEKAPPRSGLGLLEIWSG
jgi:hypothetical protein